MLLDRRSLLSALLPTMVLVPTAAQTRSSYRGLREPVSISLAALAEPWSSVSFSAFVALPEAAPGEPHLRLVRGVALRLPAQGEDPSRIEVYSTLCPHEICTVALDRPPDSVELGPGDPPDHPLLVCPCHFSVFDPVREGEVLAGPAHRGLYRFDFRLDGERVTIEAVEEAVLR